MSLTFLPASFRGVPFHVTAGDTSVGRRVVVHEFPKKERGFTEDMGREMSEFTVDGFIVGENYMDGMRLLMGALMQPGPGTLVHPSLGTLDVVLKNKARLREQFVESRGMVRFSLNFVESGIEEQPSAQVDTQQLVDETADACYGPIEDDFASVFSIDGAPAWSVEAISSEILRVADTVDAIRNSFHLDFSSLSSLLAAGKALRTNTISLMAAPGALSKELTVLIGGMVDLFDFSAAQSQIFGGLGIASSSGGSGQNGVPFGSAGLTTKPLDAMLQLAAYSRPAVPTDTPVRRQQAANQAALLSLVRRTAAVEAARSSIYIPFDSADHATSTRDRLYDVLEALLLDAPDTVYRPLQDLRVAMVRDITARGAQAAQITTLTLPGAVPARVLSYRLYGTGAYADEIVARNQRQGEVMHPLFLPAGVPLEVRRV